MIGTQQRPATAVQGVAYDFEQEASPARFFPLRFLGMGLFIAWLSCTHISLIFPGPGCDLDARTAFDMGMRVGDIGTFVVLALAARRIGVLSRHPSACFALVTLCTAGTALVGLVALPAGLPHGLIFLLSVPTAIGGAVLFCLWGQVYCSMGMTQSIVEGALSCVTALAMSGLVAVLKPPFAVIATALLPLASMVAAALSLRVLPTERPADLSQRYPMPWKLLAIMAIGSFITGASSLFMDNADYMGSIHRVLATGVFGMVVLGLAWLHRDKLDARTLALAALGLAVFSLVLVPFAQGSLGAAVSFTAKFSFVFFTFFVLLVIVGIVRRFEVPSLRLFAVTRIATELPLLMGLLLMRAVRGSGVLDSLSMRVIVALVGLVLVLVLEERGLGERRLGRSGGGHCHQRARAGAAGAVPGPLRGAGRALRAHGAGERAFDTGPAGQDALADRAGAVPFRQHGEDPFAPRLRQARCSLEGRGSGAFGID